MHIELSVSGQRLRREMGPGIVGGSRYYLTAHVAFAGHDWDSCQVWLRIDKDGAQNAYLLDADGCVTADRGINLPAGQYTMSLLGLRDEVRITTNEVPLCVLQSGADGGEPLPEIPQTAAEQIALLAQEAVDTARSVREDADAGQFNGKDGAPGKAGVSAEHQWDGSVLTITSASGTSSADLRGPQGPEGKQGPQGQAGKDAPQDAVRYGVQALTDEEQAQARGNIGAASAGELSRVKGEFCNTLIGHRGFQVNITRANLKKKVYCKYPQGTALSFVLSNIYADIDGSVSGAIRLIYDDNGVETIDSTYRAAFSINTSKTGTIIKKELTLPFDIIGFEFFYGNYASTVTVNTCTYDVDFYIDEQVNIQKGVAPFVAYTVEQNLTKEQKEQARNNIDAANSSIQSALFNIYYFTLESNETSIGEYWNKYVEVAYKAGETLKIQSKEYTGTKLRYLRIQGRKTGTTDYTELVKTNSLPYTKTITLTEEYDQLWFQIARTETEFDVSATVYILSDSELNTGSELLMLQSEINKIKAPNRYTCLKDGSGDFNSLVNAVNTVCEEMDAILYVGPGTWDIIAELGEDYLNTVSSSNRGLYLKNRVHVICSSDALITCHYTGDRTDTVTWLSAFNSGEYGFTLENARIESSHCRYTIHDERDTHTDFYENKYINCIMKHDNTDGGYAQVIGGGLGKEGHIIIDGCIFENPNISNRSVVSYHNTWYAGGDGRSTVEVKGCYFKGTSTFRCSWFGASQEISTFLVHGNSLGKAIEHVVENQSYMDDNPTWIQNTELFAWNNEIRTS